MFSDTDLQNGFKKSIVEIKKESESLKNIYASFFDFNIILTSDTGSKTAVNREYIYESNQTLKESTAIINAIFDEMFLRFKKYIISEIPNSEKENFDMNTFVFDNEKFISEVTRVVSNRKTLSVIKNILFMKDKLYTLKYVLKKANTLAVCKKLNKMNTNELQNSQSIFKIIDHLGILANNFTDFNNRVEDFEKNYIDKVDLDLNFLDSIIVSETVNIEEFIFQNKKHKFFLNYHNLSNESEELFLDKVYLENILSNLIEQACLDVIKKEKYVSKSDRTITLKASLLNKNLILTCISDGIYKQYIDESDNNSQQSENQNKALVHAKNLLDYIDGKLEVKDSGNLLEYKATIKLNKKLKSERDKQED